MLIGNSWTSSRQFVFVLHAGLLHDTISTVLADILPDHHYSAHGHDPAL
jgi:hypothetical protein